MSDRLSFHYVVNRQPSTHTYLWYGARTGNGAYQGGTGITTKISMKLENKEAVEPMIDIALLFRRRALRNHLHYLRIAGWPIAFDVTLVFTDSEYIQRAAKEFGRRCRSFCPSRSQTGRTG
jgi:hypothetical protein